MTRLGLEGALSLLISQAWGLRYAFWDTTGTDIFVTSVSFQ